MKNIIDDKSIYIIFDELKKYNKVKIKKDANYKKGFYLSEVLNRENILSSKLIADIIDKLSIKNKALNDKNRKNEFEDVYRKEIFDFAEYILFDLFSSKFTEEEKKDTYEELFLIPIFYYYTVVTSLYTAEEKYSIGISMATAVFEYLLGKKLLACTTDITFNRVINYLKEEKNKENLNNIINKYSGENTFPSTTDSIIYKRYLGDNKIKQIEDYNKLFIEYSGKNKSEISFIPYLFNIFVYMDKITEIAYTNADIFYKEKNELKSKKIKILLSTLFSETDYLFLTFFVNENKVITKSPFYISEAIIINLFMKPFLKTNESIMTTFLLKNDNMYNDEVTQFIIGNDISNEKKKTVLKKLYDNLKNAKKDIDLQEFYIKLLGEELFTFCHDYIKKMEKLKNFRLDNKLFMDFIDGTSIISAFKEEMKNINKQRKEKFSFDEKINIFNFGYTKGLTVTFNQLYILFLINHYLSSESKLYAQYRKLSTGYSKKLERRLNNLEYTILNKSEEFVDEDDEDYDDYDDTVNIDEIDFDRIIHSYQGEMHHEVYFDVFSLLRYVAQNSDLFKDVRLDNGQYLEDILLFKMKNLIEIVGDKTIFNNGAETKGKEKIKKNNKKNR